MSLSSISSSVGSKLTHWLDRNQRSQSNRMLKVGDPFPSFKVKAVVSSDVKTAFTGISLDDYSGKWVVLFAWPKDFTFVCPTEIEEFGKLNEEFNRRNAQVLGMSTDSEYVHLAWRQSHKAIKDLPFPMLSDVKREISLECGILDQHEGVSQRATFIIDPDRMIRFTMVTDLKVGRNPKEVLRILDALQTGELCPANWETGQETL